MQALAQKFLHYVYKMGVVENSCICVYIMREYTERLCLFHNVCIIHLFFGGSFWRVGRLATLEFRSHRARVDDRFHPKTCRSTRGFVGILRLRSFCKNTLYIALCSVDITVLLLLSTISIFLHLTDQTMWSDLWLCRKNVKD